jgi:hypothetical protein
MPGFNGMGPTGAGPRTGRCLGRCSGGPVAGGWAGRGWRSRGFGFGRGFGLGRGYYYDKAYNYDPAYNKSGLKDYESYLENEIKYVRQELQRTDEE